MDRKDRQIIDLLQHNGKMSYAEIGDRIDLSITAVKERIKKLIEDNTLKQNVFLVNPISLGLQICAFVQVLMPVPSEEKNFVEQVNLIPEVLECHTITGEYSYLLKIRLPDMLSLEDLLSEKIKTIKGVVRTNSIISLKTYKEITQLKIPDEKN